MGPYLRLECAAALWLMYKDRHLSIVQPLSSLTSRWGCRPPADLAQPRNVPWIGKLGKTPAVVGGGGVSGAHIEGGRCIVSRASNRFGAPPALPRSQVQIECDMVPRFNSFGCSGKKRAFDQTRKNTVMED